MNRSSCLRPPHLLAITLLLAPMAWAQSESIAIHPCVVKGGSSKTAKKLQDVCTQAMTVSDGVKSTGNSNSDEFLRCLGRLASDRQASRSVLIALTLESGNTEQQQSQVSGGMSPSGSGSDTQAVVTTSPSQQPAVVPPVTETQTTAQSRTWKTPVAYGTAGTGVVAGVLAVVFAVQAGTAYDKLDAEYQNGTAPPPSRSNEIAGLRDDIARNRTLAGVSAAVGAVLVGTGAYLWFSDKPSETKPGTASLSIGPGGVGLRVLLP